jgi:transcriptional regulator with XRE-family HTH domain
LSSIEDLAGNLREARRRSGFTLSQAAQRTGLSRAYISALERGAGKRPGADVVRRLEDLFGPLTPGRKEEPAEVPPGLAEFARERALPPAEIRMLAGIRVRGAQPISSARWGFIYDALVASETMDRKR